MNSANKAVFSFSDIPSRLLLKDATLLHLLYQNAAMKATELSDVLMIDDIAVRNSLYRLMDHGMVDKVQSETSLRYSASELAIDYFVWQENVNAKPVDFEQGDFA